MNYTNKVCSFTGYRPQKLNACIAGSTNPDIRIEDVRECLKAQMIEMLDRGFTTFQSGMAIGADIMFAQIAVELKQIYTSTLVKLIAIIPCLEHNRNWSEYDRTQYKEIIDKADEVVLVSNTQYYDGCMAKRNRHLADTCDELLAVYDGQRGGTMQTINYAKGRGVKVTIIDPSKAVIITLRESYGEIITNEKAFTINKRKITK